MATPSSGVINLVEEIYTSETVRHIKKSLAPTCNKNLTKQITLSVTTPKTIVLLTSNAFSGLSGPQLALVLYFSHFWWCPDSG